MSTETLLLVPTEMERTHLRLAGSLDAACDEAVIVGFGPVAAAARTALLLAERRPERVLLVGVAGTYDRDALPPGAAACFGAVAIDGVGAGSGASFQLPSRLGLAQWPGGLGTSAEEVHETLALAAPPGDEGGEEDGALLLTVCAASATPAEVAERCARHPDARAEDMEAFGVALACALAGVELTVVRGISNVAGDRDRSGWCVAEALASAAGEVSRLLEAEEGS